MKLLSCPMNIYFKPVKNLFWLFRGGDETPGYPSCTFHVLHLFYCWDQKYRIWKGGNCRTCKKWWRKTFHEPSLLSFISTPWCTPHSLVPCEWVNIWKLVIFTWWVACVLHGTENSAHLAFTNCIPMHITDSFFGGEDENALGWIAVKCISVNCIAMPRVLQCNCNLMQCRYFTDVQRVASFRWPDCIGLYSSVLHCTASVV